MTVMPEIHDALARAVRRRRGRQWLRAGIAVAGIAVISGTAVAATGTWRPQLGADHRGPRPLASARSVPSEQLHMLAVLRRPQTDRDRGPLVEQALKGMSRDFINGIHTDAIRVLFQNRREIVVLVPVRRNGSLHHEPGPQRDALCLMSSSYADARTFTYRQKGPVRRERRPAGFVNGWSVNCGDTRSLRHSGVQGGTSPDPLGAEFD